jgi:GNAT superfamily N-acetyltransferase
VPQRGPILYNKTGPKWRNLARKINNSGIVVSLLKKERDGEAIDVLSRAFWQDPVLTFFLDDARRRKFAYRAFFGDVINSNRRSGHVYAAFDQGRLVGAAAWRPPDAGLPTNYEQLQSLIAEWKVRTLFPGKGRCIFEGFAATRELHPPCPHWYLCFVGVDPRMHAMGIGTALLRPVLQRADRDGTCCYLETPFPQTHAFYERLGFQIASKGHPFAGAPPLWTMTRNCIGMGESE